MLATGLGGGATGSGCDDIAHPASKPVMENDQNNRLIRMAAKLAPDPQRIEIKERHRTTRSERLTRRSRYSAPVMRGPIRKTTWNRIAGSAVVFAAFVSSLGCMNDKAVSSSPKASGSAPVAKSQWTNAGGGLELSLEGPSTPLQPGSSVALTLHFRNASTEPLRVYLLPEPFRANICTLFVMRSSGPGFFPPPRGHGHMPTTDDFPLIAPGATLDATQTIEVPHAGEDVEVHWDYENRVTSVAGGVQTLDGVTKPLFGGGPIPHIWTGRATVIAHFALAK